MAKLKNSIIEKLVSEGKVSSGSGQNMVDKNKEIYYKQKMSECLNYKSGYYSRKVILTSC